MTDQTNPRTPGHTTTLTDGRTITFVADNGLNVALDLDTGKGNPKRIFIQSAVYDMVVERKRL